MLGFILLGLIVAHEIYTLVNMKEYCKMSELMRLTKGRNRNDEIYIQARTDLTSNKKYATLISLSYIHLLSIITLLFTQYWLISLMLIALGFVVYKLKNDDDNNYINYLDGFTVIIVIVLGLVIL